MPAELKEFYGTYFLVTNDTTDYYVYSPEENYELTHYCTGMNNQLLTKGFHHYYVINGMEFKLGANQGDPCLLRNKKLYYSTELNLAEYIFEKAKFIEIDLTEYLNE